MIIVAVFWDFSADFAPTITGSPLFSLDRVSVLALVVKTFLSWGDLGEKEVESRLGRTQGLGQDRVSSPHGHV